MTTVENMTIAMGYIYENTVNYVNNNTTQILLIFIPSMLLIILFLIYMVITTLDEIIQDIDNLNARINALETSDEQMDLQSVSDCTSHECIEPINHAMLVHELDKFRESLIESMSQLINISSHSNDETAIVKLYDVATQICHNQQDNSDRLRNLLINLHNELITKLPNIKTD